MVNSLTSGGIMVSLIVNDIKPMSKNMKPLTIPDFKLKFLEREPIAKNSRLGSRMPSPHTFDKFILWTRRVNLSGLKPVPDPLTLDFIKSKPKYFLYGVLPSPYYERDDKTMKHLFQEITCSIPEVRRRLVVVGHNGEDDKKVGLLDITPRENLREEYFGDDNGANSCYEELVVLMIENECTIASFQLT